MANRGPVAATFSPAQMMQVWPIQNHLILPISPQGAHFGSPFGYGQPLGPSGAGQYDSGAGGDTPPSHRVPTIAVQQPSLPYGGIGHGENSNGPSTALNNGYGARGQQMHNQHGDLEEEEEADDYDDEEDDHHHQQQQHLYGQQASSSNQQQPYRPGPSALRQRF